MIEKKLAGTVTPPADMMAAAKASLEPFPGAFDDLMEQTGGADPTPDQLCKMIDGCRQARFIAELNEIMPQTTMEMIGSVGPPLH